MSWEFGSYLHRLSRTALPDGSEPFVVPDELRMVLSEKEEVLRENAQDAAEWLAQCLLRQLILMLDQVAASPAAPKAMEPLVGLDDVLYEDVVDEARYGDAHTRLLIVGDNPATNPLIKHAVAYTNKIFESLHDEITGNRRLDHELDVSEVVCGTVVVLRLHRDYLGDEANEEAVAQLAAILRSGI